MIQSMNAITVRGNQDDKALAAYVQWKNGKALVGSIHLPVQAFIDATTQHLSVRSTHRYLVTMGLQANI